MNNPMDDGRYELSASARKREREFRRIVERHQYGPVGGTTVDATTAQAVCQVLDALSPPARELFLNRPVQGIVDITWKLFSRCGNG